MLADVLHLSLHSCRRLHASLGTPAVVLAMLHAIIAGATTGKLNLQTPKDTFALVVSRHIQLWDASNSREVLRPRLAVHRTFMHPVYTSFIEERPIRSSPAIAPDIGVRPSIRALAPYPIRNTLSKLIHIFRWCSISFQRYYFAWQRSLS